MRRTDDGCIPSNSAAVVALVGHIYLVGIIGRVLMALNTKVFGFKEHKVICAANGVIEGVMAVGTLSYVIGIRMSRIQHNVLAIHALCVVTMR